MTQYVLDTDHVSLWLEGHLSVQSRISQSGLEVAITIITVQELFNGWTARINDPKQASRLVDLYTKLWLVVVFFKAFPSSILMRLPKLSMYACCKQNHICVKNGFKKIYESQQLRFQQTAF